MHSNRQRCFRAPLAPPALDQLGWIGIELATPMHHVAFFIGDVEIELGMRVRIMELRDDALHGDGVASIIRNSGAMMRGSGKGGRNDNYGQERKTRLFYLFHFRNPLQSILSRQRETLWPQS